MQPRTALVAAIISGLAAAGLVAADVAWSLEARLDTFSEGTWTTVASRPGDEVYRETLPRGPGCAERELRLVVHNDKPFGDSVHVLITFHNESSGRTATVLDETWHLERFGSRTYEFTVPSAAFPPPDNTTRREKFIGGVGVEARVDDLWLSTCVQKEVES